MRGKFADLTGKCFGQLVVLSRGENPAGHRNPRWICQCSCGKVVTVLGLSLRGKRTKSCGHTRFTINGLSKIPEYKVFSNMIARCENPNEQAFKDYGGRGIRICARWRHSFLAFYKDLGPRPTSKHQLDRKNPNGNYTPTNCRWVKPDVQCNNKRNTIRVIYCGQRLSLSDAVELSGISISNQHVLNRLKLGWDIDSAIETPVTKYKKRH